MSEPHFPRLAPGEEADICLLLEGSYPYIRGGVSSWVDQLIRGLPQHRFAVIFIGASPEHYEGVRYAFPPNLCHVEAHFLNQSVDVSAPRPRKGNPAWFDAMEHLHTQFKTVQHGLDLASVTPFIQQLQTLVDTGIDDFFYSERAWERITREYATNCPNMAFNEYFWTIRSMHTPLFALLGIAQQAPPSRIYHAISTGYAGTLGFFLRIMRNTPLLLTEHGIYTKERYIDLYQADWIHEQEATLPVGLHGQISYIRRLWGRFFEGLGRLTYAASRSIITLYPANQRTQVEYGADPARCHVIPNGVDVTRLKAARLRRPTSIPPVMGLIGRVVPIKDIKTFIRAAGIAQYKMPLLEAWIIGGEDEDPHYAAECHALVAQLGLQDTVKFLGFQAVDAMLPHLGVVVLTSISEGQPLSVLEAYAAGVPVVVTDVGSCRDLVEGTGTADQALGKAGSVVPLANPQAVADAAVQLLNNPTAWYAAQTAAIARVEQFYTQTAFLRAYETLYQKVLEHGRNRV
jgi:glycosyltransferase involved in cell wall biosynthesis